jgi:hypothetical protein
MLLHCACMYFSVKVIYNVIFSLEYAHDSFDGTIKIFELLKQLRRYTFYVALQCHCLEAPCWACAV